MKIMFICSGNTCRSAMAEAMVSKKTEENNTKNIEVCSAGTEAKDGAMPVKETVEIMKERGIDISKHKATNIQHSNIKNMDLILCATNAHKVFTISMYPEVKNKTFTMEEYANNKNKDIPDPWGGTREVYENCANELEKCVDKILEKV